MKTGFFRWIAGFFQDQKQQASRKAAALYAGLYYFYIIIQGNLDGKKVDDSVMMWLAIIILFCLGAITAEFISSNSDLFNKDKKDE